MIHPPRTSPLAARLAAAGISPDRYRAVCLDAHRSVTAPGRFVYHLARVRRAWAR